MASNGGATAVATATLLHRRRNWKEAQIAGKWEVVNSCLRMGWDRIDPVLAIFLLLYLTLSEAQEPLQFQASAHLICNC